MLFGYDLTRLEGGPIRCHDATALTGLNVPYGSAEYRLPIPSRHPYQMLEVRVRGVSPYGSSLPDLDVIPGRRSVTPWLSSGLLLHPPGYDPRAVPLEPMPTAHTMTEFISELLANRGLDRVDRPRMGSRLPEIIATRTASDARMRQFAEALQPIDDLDGPEPEMPGYRYWGRVTAGGEGLVYTNESGEEFQCIYCDAPGTIRFAGGLPECDACASD